MANIMIRKENMGTQAARPEWDAGRWAREFLRWDPFREMLPAAFEYEGASFAPAFEIKETKEGYQFKADVPGVAEKDLEITRTGNRLTIAGKRESEREEKGETYYACERSYGHFARTFTLPEGIDGDHVHADLKEGVLTLLVPKMPEAQPKRVQIRAKGPVA